MSRQSTIIVVNGATGRMGARVCALALNDPSFTLIAALEHASSPRIGAPAAPGAPDSVRVKTPENVGELAHRPDVVIDFSSDAGAISAASVALAHGAALLVGTTALSPATLAKLRSASQKISVLIAPNTSLGVVVLASLVARAASALASAGFDCAIVESHHARKKDAPSGTAIRLAAAARNAGVALPDKSIVSIRGGDVIGEHTVRFAGAGEYIELTHRATSRDVFAMGALRAAAWLKGRAPGLYTIEDALGIGA